MDDARRNESEPTRSKRERSPSFPYLDLDTSVEHLEKLYVAAKAGEARLVDVASAWGMAPKSGSVMRYVAALSQFGLVETMGSGDNRRIKVSAEGRRILEDDRPGVREQLRAEVALKPRIIRGLFHGEDGMEHWGHDRPSDQIAKSHLKFELKFGSEAADRFLNVYDATIAEVPESERAVQHGVNGYSDGRELAEETMPPSVQDKLPDNAPNPNRISSELQRGEVNKINFRSEGDGTVSIRATLDVEGLDVLEKKIAALKMLLE